MKPKFFRTQSEFSAWLEKNHDTATELWVGYYKKNTGRQSITWSQSVDVALCWGWIDGIRKSIDEARYTNRFTPRRPGSNWSARNIKRAQELIELGLMQSAGRKAFEARTDDRSAIYSYEQRHNAVLDPEYERQLRRNRKAWAFFDASPSSYRKAAVYWIMSAKREETRRRRLARLIEDSANGQRVPPLTSPGRPAIDQTARRSP